MKTSQIRAEIIELINAGKMNVAEIVNYFETYMKDANLTIVKREAKELVSQVKAIRRNRYSGSF